MTWLFSHPGEVGFRLMQHLGLTFGALGIALPIALAAGIAAARSRRAGAIVSGVFGTLYTVPSLATLALLVPVLGLGYLTALTALVIYAQMILVRSIATGLRSVPEPLREAAAGLGMTSTQRLLRVEFPQAAPVIVSGIRVAVLALIAIANLAAWVDAGGLGALIFDGLRRDIPGKIIAGAVASAALAITADSLLRALERSAQRRAAVS